MKERPIGKMRLKEIIREFDGTLTIINEDEVGQLWEFRDCYLKAHNPGYSTEEEQIPTYEVSSKEEQIPMLSEALFGRGES